MKLFAPEVHVHVNWIWAEAKYCNSFPKLATNDFRVTQVTTAKSLGVTIDDNLDWGSHIEKITKKVSSGIGAIKRVRHLIPKRPYI